MSNVESEEMWSFTAGHEPGLQREMVEGVARLHGLRVEASKIATAERIPRLLNAEADLISGIVDTPERRQQIAFTSEVLPVQHVALTCRPRAPITTLAELRRVRIGLITGSSWYNVAREAGVPVAKATLFPDGHTLLAALCAGQVEATVMTAPDLILERRRFPGLEAGLPVGDVFVAAWGLRRQDTRLLQELDAYLNALRRGASWSRLLVKYYGANALRILRPTAP
jgi:ABC-type amino acid transport substrate-binding protein